MSEELSTFGVAGIWTVMCGTVIETESGRESNARFESVLLDQRSCTVLDVFGDLSHCHTRPNGLSGVAADKSVNLCSAPDVLVGRLRVFIGQFLLVSHLLRSCSPCITVMQTSQKSVEARSSLETRTRLCKAGAHPRDIHHLGKTCLVQSEAGRSAQAFSSWVFSFSFSSYSLHLNDIEKRIQSVSRSNDSITQSGEGRIPHK